uniref:Proline and glutamate rich with coiled coil 1 n=1 Tax=Takifugu rubripes TaxID=31033 RepID=A0A674PCR2_TAKRU
MATGIIRNFLIPAPPPSAYLPLIFQQCPYSQDKEKMQEDNSEVREGEEYEEEEEEEEEDCDIVEEEEEECAKEAFLTSGPQALDVTKRLLRFADLINRDVQHYFGRSSGEEACDIYSDPISVTTSGRLRYYDDLLRIARESPEEPENSAQCREAQGGSGLGPLAELFQLGGTGQGHNRPMIKRHLPLSFWSEPSPRCPAGDSSHPDPDFSDLLAVYTEGLGGAEMLKSPIETEEGQRLHNNSSNRQVRKCFFYRI